MCLLDGAAGILGIGGPRTTMTEELMRAQSEPSLVNMAAMIGARMSPSGYMQIYGAIDPAYPKRRKHDMEYKVGIDVIDGHVLITVGCKRKIVHNHSEMMAALHKLASEELDDKIFTAKGYLKKK